MYSDRFYASVYWAARQESVDECTARAEAYFRCLAAYDPELSHWFQKGRSRRDALKRPVIPDSANLRKLLLAGRNRRDDNREVIEELGFSLYLWNGGPDGEAMALQINCGQYGPWTGANLCQVDLAEQGPTADRLLTIPSLTRLLTCMIDAWDPDWGVIDSRAYQDMRLEEMKRIPRSGWLIYISHRFGRVPLVPAPATVTPFGAHGSLITVTPDRFDALNPAHVEAADRVAAALDAAKLRRPWSVNAAR